MSLKLFSKKQDTGQFERLAAESERQVYSVCFHMMGNREDAQDCAQEAMLRAFRAFGSFRQDASFSTWITRIAMNVCTDALRKRRDAVSLDALREEQGFDVPDAAPTAYARLEEHERLRLLREGLSLLPADMREMIVLRDVQGKSYEEIGEILDVPLGTVKSRVSRAREKLSVILKKSSELFSSSSV
jgi:RNA polymerase sigma-70 factor (ECF subfamily)